MRVNKRAMSGILSFVLAATFCISSTVYAETIKWKMQSFYPPAVKHGDLLGKDFADIVRELSGGDLDIEVYNAGEIVKGAEIRKAVQRGVVDAGISVGSYWSGEMPIATMEYGLPFTFENPAEYNTFLHDKGFIEILREAYEEKGCYYVGLAPDNGFALLTKKPVRNISDLKKLKLRATGTTGNMLEKLGASMVSLSGSELYTALSTGTIDGCVYGGFETQWQLGNHEVNEYVILPKIMKVHGPNTFIVNLEKWHSLSDRLKTVVKTAWDSQSQKYYRYKYNSDIEYLDKMEDYGLEIITLSKEAQEEMQEASREVMAEVAEKDESTSKAVKAMKEYLDFLK